MGKEYDCCNCSHYRVCYKIRMYHVGQENTGLYCPSFDKKQSEVAREIFEELEDVLKIVVLPCVNEDGCITPLRASYWSIDPNDYAALKKKYTEEVK